MVFRRILLLLCLCVFAPCMGMAQICGAVDEGASPSVAESRALARSSYLPALALQDDLPPPGPPLREPDMVWVDSVLTSMTLEEKIGQMLMSSSHGSGESLIDQYHIGGFVFLGNGQLASNIVASVNRLQTYSPFPLWFAIDAEAGLGARVADATIYPMLMGFGATDDPTLTEMCGHITARECRAVGVQIAFGPVVDVNTEPLNPIISTRSYGDTPELVTRLARGFVHGARSEGLLCTFKHYPGHGATTGDSHSSLPTVDLPLETLEAVHIKPYRDLVGSSDVDFVMTAHVWFSQVDTEYGKPWPATLSPKFIQNILRESIAYPGVIISDSYGMAGLSTAVPDERERAVLGVEAGLDIILNPPSVGEAFIGIRDAVISSRISQDRINQSVRRILIAKSRVGLPEQTTVDPDLYPMVLRHPVHRAAVRQVCERAFTRAKDTISLGAPVATTDHVLLLTLSASTQIFYRRPSSYFTDPFIVKVPNTDLISVGTSVSSTQQDAILQEAALHDKVVIAGYDWTRIASSSQVSLINALTALSVPVIYVGFGAPYHYLQIPDVDAFYCGYCSVDEMQQVAAEVLVGERSAVGALPVTIPGLPAPPSGVGWIAF